MSLANTISIFDQDINTTTINPGAEALGQIGTTDDMRAFKYSRAGATTLAPGLLTNAPTIVANHITRTLTTAFTFGTQTILVPIGATAVATNQYAGGYLVVTDGTGKGQTLGISGNTASAGSTTITVTLGEGLYQATDTTSVVGLYPNLNSANVLAQASAAFPVTGVPLLSVPANNYYWSQVSGYASVLIDASPVTKNANAIVSAATQGAASIQLAASVTQVIGFAPELTVATKYSPLVLGILS